MIGMTEGVCPFSGGQSTRSASEAGPVRRGPRGCAFAGFGANCPLPSAYSDDPHEVERLHLHERRTINEMLLPEAPPRELTKGMKNADSLPPEDDAVLAVALGAPARRVLMRAEEIGPRTGWKDGYLSATHGFCAPDPSDSPVALRASPGRVWSDLCERMPGVVARGNMRNSILALPLIYATPDVIPDRALWAATVCLGILASTYRYEERNDGSEGISVTPPPGTFRNITGDADDEEEETKGIPRNIAIPLKQACVRMGRPLPHLTQFDVSIYNFKIRDPTSVHPYVARSENMDLRWPVFNDRGEAMFLLCMAEVHGCFVPGVEIVTRCQEAVMNRDKEGLLREMVKLKALIDQLPFIFHKISVNPNSGENFANPVEWGQRYAKWSAPLSRRVPALSGLALPLFLLMDAFLGRTKYTSFLGIEAVHLRRWLPLNIRAFIAAIETSYKIPEFINNSNDSRLEGILEGLIESYAGERGFMGTHRYKVYGFLEVVAKTGRTETNGNAGAGDSEGRAWEEVHRTLSDSMKERLDPYRGAVAVQPHEMRGSFEECRFKARILERQNIDNDSARSTGMVTFDLQGSGITFQPGDRLAVMPFNNATEVDKMAAALGLDELMDVIVPVEKGSEWARFSRHLGVVSRAPIAGLTVRDILKRGHLAPLTKDLVMAFHMALRASSRTILKVLASEEWPVPGSVGDLLQKAIGEVPGPVWDQAFELVDLSWLPKMIPLEVPRTYSISNYSPELLPSMIDLTVSRTERAIHPALEQTEGKTTSCGISSGFLNPKPKTVGYPTSLNDEGVLIGISRPINFQLPPSTTAPVAMFAGGSGIAPFRGFWQARVHNGIGRNVLFLGIQSREKFVYEDELRSLVQEGSLELHLAFSRDRRGLVYDPMSRELIERDMEPHYIDSTIVEQGRIVSELVMSKSQGGQAGYLYVCGSVSVYETVMSGIRKAIYQYSAATSDTADAILASAFAERRFMLDIFMTPRPMSYKMPTISLSQLARNTGHRKGSRMWIGVHGGVYDVTDFLDIHPGGTLIVAASAGLDATKTFDDLAHTSNPEVSSLLSKYFIGHLATKPDFRSPELSDLYNVFYQYLRTCVESLTTLFFEANHILENSKVWFQGGLLNIGGVRKFYQFQSRLMQNGFSTLFGGKLQEIYLKLSFTLASAGAPNVQLPDVIGTITRAQSSHDAAIASKEISQIGQFVCNSSKTAQFHENGIIEYAQAVTEMDITFLEHIRDEVCMGMDAFDSLASMEESSSRKQVKLSAFLLTVLERIAKRLESFYASLAQQSIYRPEIELNPARSRWNMLRRKIFDGSLFILAQVPQLDHHDTRGSIFRPGATSTDVDFTHVFESVQRALRADTSVSFNAIASEPKRLADAHTARANTNASAASTFETRENAAALRQLGAFISENASSIRRLSRIPAAYDFDQIMAAYGEKSPSSPHHVRTRSGLSSTSMPRQKVQTPPSQLSPPLQNGTLNRRAPPAESSPPAPLFTNENATTTATTAPAPLHRRQPTPTSSLPQPKTSPPLPILHRRAPPSTSVTSASQPRRQGSNESMSSAYRAAASVAGSLPGTLVSGGAKGRAMGVGGPFPVRTYTTAGQGPGLRALRLGAGTGPGGIERKVQVRE
ncbi:hypothetical protein M501DRAFT_1018193 [Patellaria atrata CBS 101060]|uniref:NADPH--hemoprotein reductase n=1 Tax=Patellaria atrata CBS 101060 TaxID=1346257 RepID=A0A9P4S6Z5_9PEZI|nr:hypothetical protein M501DRAFT_1018193 [Patellaria atrata CBS 101060]